MDFIQTPLLPANRTRLLSHPVPIHHRPAQLFLDPIFGTPLHQQNQTNSEEEKATHQSNKHTTHPNFHHHTIARGQHDGENNNTEQHGKRNPWYPHRSAKKEKSPYQEHKDQKQKLHSHLPF